LLLADPLSTEYLDVRTIIHLVFLGVVHDSGAADFETRWRQIIQVSLGNEALKSVNVPSSMKVIRKITQEFNEASEVSSCTIAEAHPTKLTRIREDILVRD
jgi:hypothetical protein